MSSLSRREHWDTVHAHEEAGLSGSSETRSPLLSWIRRALGDRMLERLSAYDHYLLWEVLFPRCLPSMTGTRVLEVGSAPGEFLVRFARKYRCTPYGVDYSQTGVDLNRRVFAESGFEQDNVFHADFFSEEFQNRHQGSFDAVISRGFIEHFTDLDEVVECHLNLLAPGGYLVVSVPNLRGVNYALTRVLDPKVLPLHNLEIMRKRRFERIFRDQPLEQLFCGYYGTFSFFVLTAGGGVQQSLLRATHRIQPLLNLLFRILLRRRGAESAWFSPSLLYIGRKGGIAPSPKEEGA